MGLIADDLTELYYINKHISLRKIKSDYLIYSGYVRETLLVDENAYRVILFIQQAQRSYQDILNHLKAKNKEANERTLDDFLGMTLKQFIECGVVSLKH